MSISSFEAKGQPFPVPSVKIVEGYGLGKSPQLIRQILSDTYDIKINALSSLCEEAKNPQFACSLISDGIIDHLLMYLVLSSEEETERIEAIILKATQALIILCRSRTGRNALLQVLYV